MRTYLDCYPCLLRQALDAARFAGADDGAQTRVLQETLVLLHSLETDITPPGISDHIHRRVREIVGHADPYGDLKRVATEQALRLLPRMRQHIAAAPDPFERAVQVAIAGNIIDFGPSNHYDLQGALADTMQAPIVSDDLAALRMALAKATDLLYISDNAGETVFDRALIEVLDLPVTYAVKGGPVLNDATLADARAAGLEGCATLISTGSDAPGTILARTDPDFQRRFATASIIIAKGQANYETLGPGDGRIFFLLKVKCPVIAQDLGVALGSVVVKQGVKIRS